MKNFADRVSQNAIIDVLYQITEADTQRCSLEKVFWKYAANLQENTHAEVRYE